VVYRPGYVIGDTKQGRIEKIDGPYYAMTMVKRRLHMVVPNGPNVRFHLAPVDYVADGMYYLFVDEDSAGQAYHLTDPDPLSYNEFFDVICETMGTFKPLLHLPPWMLAPVMRLAIMEKLTGVPYSAFQYASHPITYETAKTLSVLARYGVTCPHFSTYVDKIVAYFLEHLQDPRIRKGDWKAGTT
jgi:nucleoside-diphosphate-sugar epimerase